MDYDSLASKITGNSDQNMESESNSQAVKQSNSSPINIPGWATVVARAVVGGKSKALEKIPRDQTELQTMSSLKKRREKSGSLIS